jgi:hypothetical protein
MFGLEVLVGSGRLWFQDVLRRVFADSELAVVRDASPRPSLKQPAAFIRFLERLLGERRQVQRMRTGSGLAGLGRALAARARHGATALVAEPMLQRLEREFLAKNRFRVDYSPFDWSLNDSTGCGNP